MRPQKKVAPCLHFNIRVKRGAYKNDTLDEEITLSSMYAGLLGTTGPDANKDGGLIKTSRVMMKSKLLKRTGDVFEQKLLENASDSCVLFSFFSFFFCVSIP